jgi:hypothetical protein
MTAPKPIAVVSKFDHSLVALTAAGELFIQVRGKWDPLAGIEGEKIASIAVKPNGALVALTSSGRIYTQHRVGVQAGDYASAWEMVPGIDR